MKTRYCWSPAAATTRPRTPPVALLARSESCSSLGALPCFRSATSLRPPGEQRSTELACALDARQEGKSFRHDHEQAESNDRPDRRRESGARDRSLTQRQGAITAAAVEPQALAACLTAGAWSSIDFGIAQTTPFIFATELYLAGLAG